MMMKKLTSIVYSLLGLLYDAVAFVGRGVTWPLKQLRSSGALRSVTFAQDTSGLATRDSTTSPLLWNPASGFPDGTYSSSDFSWVQKDGRSYVQDVTTERLRTREKLGRQHEQQILSQRPPESEPGALKFDNGKPALDLIPVEALTALGEALAYGARKYDRANWAKGIQQSRLVAAAFRHLSAYSSGEDKDPESGLGHIAHALCNLAFLTYMQKHRPDMDDRWSKK